MEAHLRAVLIEKIVSLSTGYDMGLPVQANIRETYAKLGRSRYVLRYQLLEKEVILLRVWHGREARS